MQLPPTVMELISRAQKFGREHWKTGVAPLCVLLICTVYAVPAGRSWVSQQFSPSAAQATALPSPSADSTATAATLTDVSAQVDAQGKVLSLTNSAVQDLTVQLKNTMVEVSRLTALLEQVLQVQRTNTAQSSGTGLSAVDTFVPGGVMKKSAVSNQATPSAINGPIHLNTASVSELQVLPGIGVVYAQRIIAYRTSHSGFKTIDELAKVKGIGPVKFGKLKSKVVL